MPNTQNKRLEEIRNKWEKFPLGYFIPTTAYTAPTDENSVKTILVESVSRAKEDIAFLLAEVERLEGENYILRANFGHNIPPKPIHNVTS